METLNYFSCSSCGAPNNTGENCLYCGEVIAKKNTTHLSKSDIDLFVLGLYEYKKKNYQKSLDTFEKIIIQDSKNKTAWFYKLLSQLCIKFHANSLNEFAQDLSEICIKINPHLENEIYQCVIELYDKKHNQYIFLNNKGYDNVYIKAWVDLICKLSPEFRYNYLKIYFDSLINNNQFLYNENIAHQISAFEKRFEDLLINEDTLIAILKKMTEFDLMKYQSLVEWRNTQLTNEHFQTKDLMNNYLKSEPVRSIINESIKKISNRNSLSIDLFTNYENTRQKYIEIIVSEKSKKVSNESNIIRGFFFRIFNLGKNDN